MYNQELHGGKGLYLVDQYLGKVCGKNYLDDESVFKRGEMWVGKIYRCQIDVIRCHRKLGFSNV